MRFCVFVFTLPKCRYSFVRNVVFIVCHSQVVAPLPTVSSVLSYTCDKNKWAGLFALSGITNFMIMDAVSASLLEQALLLPLQAQAGLPWDITMVLRLGVAADGILVTLPFADADNFYLAHVLIVSGHLIAKVLQQMLTAKVMRTVKGSTIWVCISTIKL